ncbi:MAG: beta-propeller fold lactonase family protein [Nitrososphaeraceae archaeon]
MVFVSSAVTTIVSVSAQSGHQQQSYMVVAKKMDEKGAVASALTLSRSNIDGNNIKDKFASSDNNSSSPSKGLLSSCPDGSDLIKGKCVCPDGSSPKKNKCSIQPNPKPIECPDGSSMVDGKCQCPDDSEISNGKCICPDADSSSPVNGKCPKPSPPGSLTFLSVVKKVINNGIGNKKPSDFTITVTGNNPSPSSFSGSSSGTSVTLRAGNYKVTETKGPSGYTTSYSSGCSGAAKGGRIQCTITNEYHSTPTTANLVVTEKVINNGIGNKKPSDFTITVTGNDPSPSSFSGSSSGTSVTLRPGSYKVTETERPSGYTTRYSSGCSGTLDAGQTEDCTITNEANKSPEPKPLVTSIRGFSGPLGLVYDSNNKYVYVTNYGDSSSSSNNEAADADKVSIIDTSTDKVIDTVSVGKKPLAITYNPNNNHVYVANTFSDTVSVIDTLRNNNIISNIAVGHFPGNSSSGIAYNSNNDNIHVANIGSDSVSEIDGSTNAVTSTIKQPFNPAGIAYDPVNGYVYVANKESNTVSVIDTLGNNKVIATIPVGTSPSAIIFDSDNGHVYVANTGSDNSRDTISVIDTSINRVIATIPVSNGPNGITLDSSSGKIYVSNTFSNNISVIDDSKNKVITTIPVGINPYGIVYNPSNHHIYVANHGSNTISVISP